MTLKDIANRGEQWFKTTSPIKRCQAVLIMFMFMITIILVEINWISADLDVSIKLVYTLFLFAAVAQSFMAYVAMTYVYKKIKASNIISFTRNDYLTAAKKTYIKTVAIAFPLALMPASRPYAFYMFATALGYMLFPILHIVFWDILWKDRKLVAEITRKYYDQLVSFLKEEKTMKLPWLLGMTSLLGYATVLMIAFVISSHSLFFGILLPLAMGGVWIMFILYCSGGSQKIIGFFCLPEKINKGIIETSKSFSKQGGFSHLYYQ